MPSQARGRERVARLLQAAAAVLAEQGYAGTTMCAVAERAETAIGSLYQFFPHKDAVVEALRAANSEAAAPLWSELIEAAPGLSASGLAAGLVELMQAMLRQCPAFAALLDAPRTAGSAHRRDLFRQRVAAVLRARQPRLTPAAAQRTAAVVQHLLRGFASLGAAYAPEFEEIIAAYLQPRLGETP